MLLDFWISLCVFVPYLSLWDDEILKTCITCHNFIQFQYFHFPPANWEDIYKPYARKMKKLYIYKYIELIIFVLQNCLCKLLDWKWIKCLLSDCLINMHKYSFKIACLLNHIFHYIAILLWNQNHDECFSFSEITSFSIFICISFPLACLYTIFVIAVVPAC